MSISLHDVITNKKELDEFLSNDVKWYKGAYEDGNYFFWNLMQLIGNNKFIIVKTLKKIGGKNIFVIGDINRNGGICGCCEASDLINAIFNGGFKLIIIYEVGGN